MGKKQTPVTNLNPSGMSENSSKSMPPLSDESKESKENLGKGVKTNANNSSGNPKSPKIVINHANPAESNSSGTPSIPFTQKIASHDGNDYKIPKKTQNLYSKHEDDPDVDYDDESVEDFVSNIFEPNSSTRTPSSSPKTKNHLKKGDEQKQYQSEPENTDLNSGPEKADSEPVSKSPELRRKKKKEDETPGSEPVNPENGVETSQLPDPGSNLTPDPPATFQVGKKVEKRRWSEDEDIEAKPRARPQSNSGEGFFQKRRLSASELREKEKKNTYFRVKTKFDNWRKRLPIFEPRTLDDCMPGLLADDIKHMRLALTLSLGLAESMQWSVDERIEAWAINLIRIFGLGLKWEYFDNFCRGLPIPEPDHQGRTINVANRRWELLAGRLFFQDLLALATHEKLSERASRLYCTLVRKLLISIWTKYGNNCTQDAASSYQTQEAVNWMGYIMNYSRCSYLSGGTNPTNFGIGCTMWPDSRQCKLALHSYSVQCVEPRIASYPDEDRIDIFDIRWDRRFERADAQFHELVQTFSTIIRKWTISDVKTPNSFTESAKWGRKFSHFKVPESDEEEKKRLYSAYDYRWDSLPQEARSRLRWKSTETIAESYTPSWARLTPRQLEEFSVIRDPCDPNFIGYALTEEDQRELNPVEEEGKQEEHTHGGNPKEKSN